MATQAEPAKAGPPFRRTVAALLLFGLSFGYVEAAIVVYLRAIYDPIRQEIHPDKPPGELLPLITYEDLKALGVVHQRRLLTELGREFATLVMLAAVALAVARRPVTFMAAFCTIFGIWDVFYYVFLKVLIDWPTSLMTWDILFLLPVPWVGPVISPVIVALTMIVFGLLTLWLESKGTPIQLRWPHWTGLSVGGLIVVLAFCWDFRNTSAGGWPQGFNWPLLTLGETLGICAIIHAIAGSRLYNVDRRWKTRLRKDPSNFSNLLL